MGCNTNFSLISPADDLELLRQVTFKRVLKIVALHIFSRFSPNVFSVLPAFQTPMFISFQDLTGHWFSVYVV